MESFFTLLNAAALLGWSFVLLILLANDFVVEVPLFFSERGGGGGGFAGGGGGGRIPLIDILLVLELICLVEVCRIASGKLRGNLVLGSVLHVIRLSCLFLVLPAGLLLREQGDDDVVTRCVLYAWSITEVCRYPMYLFPYSSIVRRVRLVAPVFTFPVGCAAEAYGAYRALMTEWRDDNNDDDGGGGGGGKNPIKLVLLGMVILINGMLGPTMAYPALLKKGLPELIGKADEKGSKGE